MKLDLRRDLRQLVACFSEHEILTYASAVAFQLLVALIPLAALSMLLMSAAHAGDVWFERVQPAVQERVTPEVFLAVSDAVARVLTQESLLWLVLAALLTLWEVSGSV